MTCRPPGHWTPPNGKPTAPAEFYHRGHRYTVARPTCLDLFNWIWERAQATLSDMKTIDHRSVAAAWRHAAENWLRCPSLITVTTTHEDLTETNQLVPLFSEKRSH
jgi:hypothetical protein